MTSKPQMNESSPKETHNSTKRPYLDYYGHSMSMESSEGNHFQYEHHPKYASRPLPSPHSHHIPHMAMVYPPPYCVTPHHRVHPPRNLQSVVTSSFSLEEDREHAAARAGKYREQRMESEDNRHESEDREDWCSPDSAKIRRSHLSSSSSDFYHRSHSTIVPSPASRDDKSPDTIRPSPSTAATRRHQHHYVQRTYSSGYYVPPESLKRSYYHHSSRPVSHYLGPVPPDFLPPKRPKTEASPGAKKELLVKPSGNEGKEPSNVYWTGRHSEGFPIHRSSSFPPPPPPSWSGKYYPPTPSPTVLYQGSHLPYVQISPASIMDEGPRVWHSPGHWTHDRPPPPTFWDSPRGRTEFDSERAWGSPPRERIGTRREADSERRVSFEQANEESKKSTRQSMDNSSNHKSSSERQETTGDVSASGAPSGAPVMLLSLPQDRSALSETLCVVRENIEVFTATLSDVNAPAPGRKHAVVVGQVGLRCIHCRRTTRSCDRVKRAVCYPSSIKRIYRTVIDMKLDHFSQCKYVPTVLKNKLDELKAIHTRSTGTTMTYFCNAAKLLGMEDASNGVVLRESSSRIPNSVGSSQEVSNDQPTEKKEPIKAIELRRTDSTSSSSTCSADEDLDRPRRTDSLSASSLDESFPYESNATLPVASPENTFEGLVPLSLPEDKTALSPLRCFLREQVCAFSATEKDIAVRAPTTFSISIGQVGIGCIHCVKQAATLRSNRAVCFPFSIGRIYQSVADIQRFHFGECKNMPDEVKDKFLELQSASSKGSKGLATRQYWVTSAKKIGLVDTTQGIRFGRDPTKPESSKSFSLDMLAHVAFSVTTASKQLVLPEDKPCIAEFLYVVMEQLQPCRFTEADRNKRRLKDVGCIGVECKHCAGQVDSRKFFWSSVSAVESNFVSVHTHMLECRMVPEALKNELIELKRLRKEQTAALKTGSQKAFFARVWNRLHDDEHCDTMNDDSCDVSSQKTVELLQDKTVKLTNHDVEQVEIEPKPPLTKSLSVENAELGSNQQVPDYRVLQNVDIEGESNKTLPTKDPTERTVEQDSARLSDDHFDVSVDQLAKSTSKLAVDNAMSGEIVSV